MQKKKILKKFNKPIKTFAHELSDKWLNVAVLEIYFREGGGGGGIDALAIFSQYLLLWPWSPLALM